MEKENNILKNILNITRNNYPDNKKINNLVKDINNTLGNKLKSNYKNSGKYNGGKDLYDIEQSSIDFNTPELLSVISNDNIKYKDNEIDILVANMPILATAIDLKKDNILPGDSISEDYMNIVNKSSISEDKEFEQNIKYLKDKYNIINLFDKTFHEMCKYGEVFHHITSFDENISGLLKNRENDKNNQSLNESNASIYNRSTSKIKNTTVYFYNNIILEEFISSNLLQEYSYKFKDVFTEDKKNDNRNKIHKRGSVIRTLKRENVIPIYINDTCLGYYYIDFSGVEEQNKPITYRDFRYNKADNDITIDLAKKIASNINLKFINTNHMYTNDIYNILKYVDDVERKNIHISYISPNNMIHWYFSKNKNNRGVSDLEKSIIPAKAYLLLSNSYKYGIITRSHDKRVYYVRQSKSDVNTSQLIQNVIDNIKRTNNGLNFFNNMSSIAGFSGLFNDIIAPVNESNESAVQFDTIPGQNINVDMDFLQEQEKQAIESMEMPYDYVKSSNEVDYATRLNHQHGKFIKHCMKRQAILEPYMSKFISLAYKYEFNIDLDIQVKLTPPVTFKNNITTGIIDSHNVLASTLADIYTDIDPEDQHSEIKLRLWKKNFINKNISAYLSDLNLDEITEKTNIEYEKYKASLNNNEEQ